MSATSTPSEALSLDQVRAGVLRRPGLVGADLRTALSASYDSWLGELFDSVAPARGVALVAVGGLGRRDLAPYSDLDLVLVHTGSVTDIGAVADSVWYPVWDSGVALDHSVRTPQEAVAVAHDDLKALLGLLDLRHIAGDLSVSAPLREQIVALWRTVAQRRSGELRELSQARWDSAGEAAFLLDPNVKDSRGGLRDAQALQALAFAHLVDVTPAVRDATGVLLDVRGELHRVTGRSEDVLRQQEQSGVAAALGYADSDAVLRAVNENARTIALAVDNGWRRVGAPRPSAWSFSPRRLFRAPPIDGRVGLARGVVSQGGEVVLARDADPWADPVLVLRAARVAAEHDLPLAPFALERLATETSPLAQPWPKQALDEFVTLLGTGPRAVPVLESLDQAGLLVGLIPEWDAVRFRAQHNPVHRYTVDRHLLETASRASVLTRNVGRPDLLLLGALLHDIGKGYPGHDHSVIGATVAERITNRIGLSYGDAATVTAMVRHHLLLPDTASRRDLADPVTISIVADAVSGSDELLGLLHALTIADAQATGPMVWSEWKGGLIADLVRRTRSMLDGTRLPAGEPLDAHRRTLAEAGSLAVEVTGDEVLVAAPDSVGVLSRAAGVLALHSLDVRSASIATHAGMAVNAFVVAPRFGSLPDPLLVRKDLARAIDGTLALAERITAKEKAYSRASDTPTRCPPTVLWFDDEATDATVLELRAEDAIGLLYRVTSTLERCGVDIRSARVSSLGGSVVDAFYVTTPGGDPIPQLSRPDIESALVAL